MARIRIADLPQDMKITRQELKRIRGGGSNSLIPVDPLTGEHKEWIEINKEIDKSSPYLA